MENLLHRTTNGFTRRYDCGTAFRLVFGSVSLKLPIDQLESFKGCIDSFDTENEATKGDEPRRIFTVFLHDGLSLGFNAAEVLELRELLQWTYASISVENLLNGVD